MRLECVTTPQMLDVMIIGGGLGGLCLAQGCAAPEYR
jgi:cation diffusion facilitator CzcD-associated flavoprotein CzcO